MDVMAPMMPMLRPKWKLVSVLLKNERHSSLGVAGPARLVAREYTAGTSILLIHSNNFVETGKVKFGVCCEIQGLLQWNTACLIETRRRTFARLHQALT